MKKIKAQFAPRDFGDVEVRRLQGALTDAKYQWSQGIEQIDIALAKLEEFREVEEASEGLDRATLDDVRQNAVIQQVFGSLGYTHQMVPDFGKYFDNSGF